MKKQIQILILSLVVPCLGFCQSKFSYGVHASPDLSVLRITDPVALNLASAPLEEKAGLGVGYTLGLQVQYSFSNRFLLRTGLNYQNRQHRYILDGLLFPSDIFKGSKSQYQNDILIQSIGIPLDLGYVIPTKKESLHFLFGLNATLNIPLQLTSQAKTIHENEEDRPATSANNQIDESLYSFGIFAGAEINLNDKLVLGLEPNFRFTPNNFTFSIFESEGATAFETGFTIRVRTR